MPYRARQIPPSECHMPSQTDTTQQMQYRTRQTPPNECRIPNQTDASA